MAPVEVAQLAGAVQLVVRGPRLLKVNSERTDDVGILQEWLREMVLTGYKRKKLRLTES
jgi:hypothetical protein